MLTFQPMSHSQKVPASEHLCTSIWTKTEALEGLIQLDSTQNYKYLRNFHKVDRINKRELRKNYSSEAETVAKILLSKQTKKSLAMLKSWERNICKPYNMKYPLRNIPKKHNLATISLLSLQM